MIDLGNKITIFKAIQNNVVNTLAGPQVLAYEQCCFNTRLYNSASQTYKCENVDAYQGELHTPPAAVHRSSHAHGNSEIKTC